MNNPDFSRIEELGCPSGEAPAAGEARLATLGLTQKADSLHNKLPLFAGARSLFLRSGKGEQGHIFGYKNSKFRGARHEFPPSTKITAKTLFLINSILLSVINIFHLSPIYSCKIVYDIIPSPTIQHLSINSMKIE